MISVQPHHEEITCSEHDQEENNKHIIPCSRVSLAYQNLTDVPRKVLKKCVSKPMRELHLSYNKIREFKFLLELPELETLILDHNELTPQVKFPECPTLQTLWVNHNRIDNLGYFIATISQSFPNLRYLSMMNNPAAPSYFNGGSYLQYQDYRHFVISQLCNLRQLDDQAITPEERSEAERIFHGYQPRRMSYKSKKR